MTKKYPTAWNLAQCFYTSIFDPQIEKDFEDAKKDIVLFIDDYKGKINQLTETDYLVFFQKDSFIDFKLKKVLLYFFFQSSLESQNQEILKRYFHC